MAYFGRYMPFLLSATKNYVVYETKKKTIYKGYFTYQANIIGYATYRLKC